VENWPSAREINVFWLTRTQELPDGVYKPIDPGEPMCFACGWYNAGSDADTAPWRGLERAHVIPRAAGGGNHPSNFALLCADCHVEAPDTVDAEWFWEWVAARPSATPWERRCAMIERSLAYVNSTLSESEQAAVLAASVDDHWRALREAARRLEPVRHFGHGWSEATKLRLIVEAARILAAENQMAS
jgi:hypothetical protein